MNKATGIAEAEANKAKGSPKPPLSKPKAATAEATPQSRGVPEIQQGCRHRTPRQSHAGNRRQIGEPLAKMEKMVIINSGSGPAAARAN
ncbi:MAG: hypothetical protein U1F83_19870 [Verrucomicrobiota bacterium]